MEVKVISLKENNEQRRNDMTGRFADAGVDFSFFDAINIENIDPVSQYLNIDFHESQLRDVEKACMLSHLMIWDEFSRSDEEYIAIFEDDIYLSPSASAYLTKKDWIPSDANLIKIEKFNKRYKQKIVEKKIAGDRVLFNLTAVNWGTAGYIISKQAVKNLLNDIKQRNHFYAIDHELFLTYLNRFGVSYQMEPALCIQDFVFNDFVQSKYPSIVNSYKDLPQTKVKKSFLEKLKKELSRLSPAHLYKKGIANGRKSTYR